MSFFEIHFVCTQPRTWTIHQFGIQKAFLRRQNGPQMFSTKIAHFNGVCRRIDRHQFGRPIRIGSLFGPDNKMWLLAHHIKSTTFSQTQIAFVTHANTVNRFLGCIETLFDGFQCFWITTKNWKCNGNIRKFRFLFNKLILLSEMMVEFDFVLLLEW